MRSSPAILHALSGAPRVAECVDHIGQCWHCGGDYTRAVSTSEWMPDTFVGQNRIRGSAHLSHVCEPCVWVMSRAQCVVPGAPPAHNWRLYTVLVDGDHVWRGNKADKPAILRWLRGEKRGEWFAAIADSGQKHVVPYAPVNPLRARRGRVQFEEDTVTIGDFATVDRMASLLTEGATKDSVTTGNYTPGEWQRCTNAIRAFESVHAHERGGPWFRLCLWLAQRDEEAVAARMAAEKEARSGKSKRRDEGGVARADGGRTARSPRGVPGQRGVRSQALGPDAGPDASGGANLGERRGVAHGDDAQPATRSADQRGLFDADDAGCAGWSVPQRVARPHRA